MQENLEIKNITKNLNIDLTNVEWQNIGKKSGIYKILNRINGKYYVGSTKNFNKRWNSHKANLNKHTHTNIHLQNSYNKFGKENFEFHIVESLCDLKIKETLEEYISQNFKNERINNLLLKNEWVSALVLIREQFYLDIAKNEFDKSYNLQFDAFGGDVSDVTRLKMSLAKKGKPNNRIGKKHTDDTKIKIGKIHRGKKLSETHKNILKNKFKGDGNPFYGKTHTDEVKEKISLTKKGKKHPMYGKPSPNKDVKIYNWFNYNLKIYENCTRTDLISKYNLTRGCITSIIHKKSKFHKGWCLIK
jgi:group I intron endonuclease